MSVTSKQSALASAEVRGHDELATLVIMLIRFAAIIGRVRFAMHPAKLTDLISALSARSVSLASCFLHVIRRSVKVFLERPVLKPISHHQEEVYFEDECCCKK